MNAATNLTQRLASLEREVAVRDAMLFSILLIHRTMDITTRWTKSDLANTADVAQRVPLTELTQIDDEHVKITLTPAGVSISQDPAIG